MTDQWPLQVEAGTESLPDVQIAEPSAEKRFADFEVEVMLRLGKPGWSVLPVPR